MMPQPVKALIFDLGNVIILFSFEKAFRKWAELSGKDLPFIQENFSFDSIHDEFERGRVSPEAFYRHVNDRFGNILSFDDFKTGWNSIYNGLVPGAEDLLQKLRKKYSLFALTNTNSIHYDYCSREFETAFKLFDQVYPSHEIGFRKPEPEVFQYVLKDRSLQKQEVLFFDDLEENVTSGRKAGIPSRVVTHPSKLKETIESAL